MEIRLAKTAGFCFGVNRAVELTYGLLAEGHKVATLGPLIHNPQAVEDMRRKGAQVVDTVQDVPAGCEVVIRSHGVPRSVYDELEADKAVRWDWLLHSPVKFSIDETTRTLVTRNTEDNFSSVAQLFSEQACSISQTDRYNAEPNEKIAVRGEDFSRPWSLTASFAPCKKTRILTIIQVEADGKQAVEIIRTGNSFQCGDWTIEAELDAKRPTALYIRNIRNRATFSLGKKNPEMNGKIYQCRKADASVLYDRIDGEWKTQEMDDREMQITGKK